MTEALERGRVPPDRERECRMIARVGKHAVVSIAPFLQSRLGGMSKGTSGNMGS